MNCETLRERLAGDPASVRETFDAHAEDCPPCRAFGDRLLAADTLIIRALRFDVAAAASKAGAGATRAGSWITAAAGIAAGLIAALTLWALVDGGRPLPAEELAQAVVEHWDHEPESLAVTAAAVTEARLTEVLYGTAELDRLALQTVSFARICRVGGEFVPHLVVQGESGPYMIVLLPGRLLDGAVPLEAPDRGLAGHILPAGRGAIAVLGAPSEELDEMESLVGQAISWTI